MSLLRNISSTFIFSLIADYSKQQFLDEPNYDDFGAFMSKAGFEWEVHDTFTQDGFILSLFHITGKTDPLSRFAPKGSQAILLNHSIYHDGLSWMQEAELPNDDGTTNATDSIFNPNSTEEDLDPETILMSTDVHIRLGA